ncbi:MAG: 50S ribosomal protein L1 [Candidatus Omnitrophica bacterium 4484_70.2]|nr:MAG: 50S ribosomal protein L1 [Candidatus Omnitrophica bacterium 4484_70.2]
MERSRRYLKAKQRVERNKVYDLKEALQILKEMPHPKFDETVEISCKLNVDPRKSDQMVRGSVSLPYGIGKKVKVLVFCEPEKEKEAKDAGADFVGGEDLIEKIQKENWLEFDYCISTPAMMKLVSRLGRILGPRGLMPSPKTGTVTNNLAQAVKEAKQGKVDFRMDKTGCIHVGVGKISFPVEHLVENIKTFLDILRSLRPAAVKGEFIKSIYLSLTMSPGLRVSV